VQLGEEHFFHAGNPDKPKVASFYDTFYDNSEGKRRKIVGCVS